MARPSGSLVLCIASALLGVIGCTSESIAPPPEVDETSLRNPPAGEVVGYTGQYGSHVWRGIPYAAPPIGDRRWQAPRATGPWTGRREALGRSTPCPQIATMFAGVADQEPGTYAGDEDCLYLDVYAPRFGPDGIPGEGERLPVMFWIHGGGNVVGHAGFYDGGKLAQSQQVVVVAINYRLAPLGFFRHAALRAEAKDALAASGNFGLLDQIRALEWVQQNIAAFGGDPGNVTIFGESAGGRNVMSLLLSEPAAGLFHRAIAQSGAARYAPLDHAEAFVDAEVPGHRNSSNEILLRYLQRKGGAGGRDEASALLAGMELEEVASLLRAISPAELIDLYTTEDTEGLIDAPNVFYDGLVLPREAPLARFADREGYNQVPIMLGTNRDEMKVFMFPNPKYVKRLFWVLPRMRAPALYEAVARIQSAAWKVVGAHAPADAIAQSGFDDVFVYRWDWDEEPSMMGADLGRMIGAAHGFEIPFVFGHYSLGPQADVVWTEENLEGRDALSGAMMSYWSEFARSGDPGKGRKGEQPSWERWASGAPDGAATMVLDTPADGGARMENGRTVARDVVALLDEHETALGGDGVCEMAEALERRFQGISSAADARAEACRQGAQ